MTVSEVQTFLSLHRAGLTRAGEEPRSGLASRWRSSPSKWRTARRVASTSAGYGGGGGDGRT